MSRNGIIHLLGGAALLTFLLATAVPSASAQEKNRSQGCHSYRIDEKESRLHFTGVKASYVVLPDKEVRARLRSQGKPGQVLAMQACNRPNLEGNVTVYAEANETSAKEEIYSATRVVILAEQDDSVKIKGHTSVWQGTGWVKRGEKLLVVTY